MLIIVTQTQTRIHTASAKSVLPLSLFRDFHADIIQGLLYSHFGWMLMKQNPKRIGRTDISDLNEDPIVIWQHKHYLKVVAFMGLIFPCLVAGFGWGDYFGGFIYAGILRIFFVQQATFCVNSLAHWLGDQPFDDRNSPRDHLVTALVTLGEGYHVSFVSYSIHHTANSTPEFPP